MSRRATQIPRALDQLVNTIVGGWADETISSVAWRKRNDNSSWALLRKVIDAIFFWQTDHCESSYESEKERRHLPPELR